MARFDKDYSMRMKALMLHPLRHHGGSPMIGTNGLKPYKIPDGPVKTRQLIIRKTKPLRGVNT